jgi:hypothetical protein
MTSVATSPVEFASWLVSSIECGKNLGAEDAMGVQKTSG